MMPHDLLQILKIGTNFAQPKGPVIFNDGDFASCAAARPKPNIGAGCLGAPLVGKCYPSSGTEVRIVISRE